MEDAMVHFLKKDIPQSGVISPILPNVHLHKVPDAWVEREAKARLRVRAALIKLAAYHLIYLQMNRTSTGAGKYSRSDSTSTAWPCMRKRPG
jgi:retron-type reverse transcriptase